MTWQIINTEPQYGVCDQCKSHECGVLPNGTQKWVVTGLLDRVGDAHVVGYRCVELWAQNLGISKEVVEAPVEVPPTDEQVLRLIKQALSRKVEKS